MIMNLVSSAESNTNINVTGGWAIMLIPTGLILLAGLIILQIYLSKRKSIIPGLILPIAFFIISLLYTAALVLLSKASEGSSGLGMILPAAIIAFISSNIPTLIFLLIYFLSRKKLNEDNNQEIKKMTIQDLE